MEYIARTREIDNELQLLICHLKNVAEKAKKNGQTWGGDFTYVCGLAHDIGKYSKAFQDRIQGKKTSVDHKTAGGKLLYEKNNKSKLGILAAYCVVGHHGGLPNGGAMTQTHDDTTLFGRLHKDLDDYSAYEKELAIPSLQVFKQAWKDGFDVAFFVRMAYSALVDADWSDSEDFCEPGGITRGGFASIIELHKKMAKKVDSFLNATDEITDLNQRRNDLLKNCISAAKLPNNLFTLTAPTGSGKTISSLAFALEHAVETNKRRIIYIASYNTIIEQNADVYEKLLGVENLLRHSGNMVYDENDDVSDNKRHSVENWDFPVIATSNVQFFESLFSSKPSKCRKLHNIANSILIFDEAQMIPVPYLLPCIRAIETLVTQYGCTAVLATATQSAIGKFFTAVKPIEISENPQELHEALKRTTLINLELPLTDEELAERLFAEKQVLCVVNTRFYAQKLFKQLEAMKVDGLFHLSTTMYPLHRERTLSDIREKLKNREECRVISTSLVEAGVDLDFETVYRQQAGLDSIIQAAGRCNREGERSAEESFVYIFRSEEHKPPRLIQPNIDAFRQTIHVHNDLSGLEAIEYYFSQLYGIVGEDRLDAKEIVKMSNESVKAMSFPFADISKEFKLIDDSAQRTVYVLFDHPDLEAQVRQGDNYSRKFFREIGKYGVSLFDYDIQKLCKIGALERVGSKGEEILMISKNYYSEATGVDLSPVGGQGLFV